MSALSGDERARLEKLVGMLASEFDGERATAAKMIVLMARKRGQTAFEMLTGPHVVAYRETVSPPWEWRAPAPEPAREDFAPGEWQEMPNAIDMLAQAAKWTGVLTPWEVNFARDLPTRVADPALWSHKQREVAERIITKARRAWQASQMGAAS